MAALVVNAMYYAVFAHNKYSNAIDIFENQIKLIESGFQKIANNKAIKNIITLDLYGTVEELIKDFALTQEVTIFKVNKGDEQIISWGRTSTLFFESLRDGNSYKESCYELRMDIDSIHHIFVYIDLDQMANGNFVKLELNENGSLEGKFLLVRFLILYFQHLFIAFCSIFLLFMFLYFGTTKVTSWLLDRKIKTQQLHDLNNETAFLKRIGSQISLFTNNKELINIAENIKHVVTFKNEVLNNNKFEYTYFDLKKSIDDVFIYLKNFFFIDNIALNLISVTVFGDSNSLKRSLYNLITNALREVSGTENKVIISIEETPKTASILISNPGNLNPKLIKRGASNYNSTGEGLSIAYNYAKKSNGTLKLTNKNGNVQFRIELKK